MESCTLILFFQLLISFSFGYSTNIDSEKFTLLQLRNEWNSTNSLALRTWRDDDSQSFCKWTGIQCVDGSVTDILLSKQQIDKPIPKSICRLKNLRHLDLSYNSIPGTFPIALYRCSNLEILNISGNQFVGTIPSDINKLSANLIHLKLAENNFVGSIPPSIGLLQALNFLSVHSNQFDGSFPVEISNLSMLECLYLHDNTFLPSRIPPEFGKLVNLKYLLMSSMNLIDEIPNSLGNLLLLEELVLSNNSLNGTIPDSIWNIQKLKYLVLFGNILMGEISGPGAALGLVNIDLSDNQLTGSIPEDFGKLENLTMFYLHTNKFSGEIPASIGLLQKLIDIRFFNNSLTGVLPLELGKHSKLQNFEVCDNKLSGGLPEFLCANQAIISLIAFNNNLTGEIPVSVANCNALVNLQLYNNKFHGDFPIGIWSAAKNLTTVIIHHNSFTGPLPDNLPLNLSRLEINDNRISGRLPSYSPSLKVFIASNNLFSGEIPRDLSGLSQLSTVQLGENNISGSIPSSIPSLKFLSDFNMRHNEISGQIPADIGSFQVLVSLDLSYNQLTGSIPEDMKYLKLSLLNLSYNQLSGQIPIQLLNLADQWSFLGNHDLCSMSKSIHNMLMCPPTSKNSNKLLKKLLQVFIVVGSVLLLVSVLVGNLYYRRRAKPRDVESWKLTSFSKLEINEGEIVQGLIPRNIIGRGGSGIVYKMTLHNGAGPTIAVKKIFNDRRFDVKLEKQFEAEVKILSSIRHANIVQLLCCISSSNSKLVVYEYIENGSLSDWLKGKQKTSESGELVWLDWPKRLKIAIDAAEGLCYMHHYCSEPIVHRDVKSSNILVDNHFSAKIADFGLARMLLNAGEPETVSCMAGTFGYMAPECGFSKKVNEKIDVYSFGVVLLELTTGRMPTNCGVRCLADWALECYQQDGTMMNAIDEQISDDPSYLAQIKAMFILGLRCTTYSPSQRPSIKLVLQWLRQIQGNVEDVNKFEGGSDSDPDSLFTQ